jgi:hypothetical protein
MCSWKCGGCGKWYSYAVSSCDCSKYLHIETSTGGSVPTPTNTASAKLPADIKEKFQRFVDEQVSLPSSFADVVNEHFWDLI